MKAESVYSRVLLKLSGEVLGTQAKKGISFERVRKVTSDIKRVRDEVDFEGALMIGGGNLFRGKDVGDVQLVTPARVHFIGMLATMMNALALKTGFEELGVETRVMSKVRSDEVCEPFLYEKAIQHLKNNYLVILAGGSGSPYFTTDSAAAIMAATLGTNALLKGTNVRGIYDSDPRTNANATMFKKISHEEAIIRKLMVMDRSAFDLCQTNGIPVVVFSNKNLYRNLKGVLMGREVGTLVT